MEIISKLFKDMLAVGQPGLFFGLIWSGLINFYHWHSQTENNLNCVENALCEMKRFYYPCLNYYCLWFWVFKYEMNLQFQRESFCCFWSFSKWAFKDIWMWNSFVILTKRFIFLVAFIFNLSSLFKARASYLFIVLPNFFKGLQIEILTFWVLLVS